MTATDPITAYPLAWPRGYERWPAECRVQSKFSNWKKTVSVADGLHRVRSQLECYNGPQRNLGRVRNLVISTNCELRLDGFPRRDRGAPDDPGVAVYFTLDDKPTVLCCDRWLRVGENLAAIGATLEAMRGLERWGVSESERAFTGFAALPAPGDVQARTCWSVLKIAPTQSRAAIDEAWCVRAKLCHPDLPGGSHDAMSELNTARDQAAAQATEP